MYIQFEADCSHRVDRSSCLEPKNLDLREHLCQWNAYKFDGGKCMDSDLNSSVLSAVMLAAMILLLVIPLDALFVFLFKRAISPPVDKIAVAIEVEKERRESELRDKDLPAPPLLMLAALLVKLQEVDEMGPMEEVDHFLLNSHELVRAKLLHSGETFVRLLEKYRELDLNERLVDDRSELRDINSKKSEVKIQLVKLIDRVRKRSKELSEIISDISSENEISQFLLLSFLADLQVGYKKTLLRILFFGTEKEKPLLSIQYQRGFYFLSVALLAVYMLGGTLCVISFNTDINLPLLDMIEDKLFQKQTMLYMWIKGMIAVIVLDAFVMQPLSICAQYMGFAKLVYIDTKKTCDRLSSRTHRIFTRSKGRLSVKSNLVQHLVPACRVAKKFPHISVCRFIIALNDFDLHILQDRISRNWEETTALTGWFVSHFLNYFLILPVAIQSMCVHAIVVVLVSILVAGFILLGEQSWVVSLLCAGVISIIVIVFVFMMTSSKPKINKIDEAITIVRIKPRIDTKNVGENRKIHGDLVREFSDSSLKDVETGGSTEERKSPMSHDVNEPSLQFKFEDVETGGSTEERKSPMSHDVNEPSLQATEIIGQMRQLHSNKKSKEFIAKEKEIDQRTVSKITKKPASIQLQINTANQQSSEIKIMRTTKSNKSDDMEVEELF
eukprot:CAMPEP_0182439556 /NCGR_PEP_ID=MMETSP1167-20130531/86512_1 /TAXON_ID=2988 /ORGANISM="Mallomonas Sp, Strain CCMP3275" /LENGTH=669 /DNA_ID=CAMNT_0024633291 /DNA_START=313 /DNA_END=2323 /DNA_ORIENTATION=+